MNMYDIPDLQKARNLHEAMTTERAAYFTTGAALGSVWRSANNEIYSDNRRNFFHKVINVFGAAGLGYTMSNPTMAAFRTFQDSPLTSPDVLQKEYGLPPEKAAVFCEEFKDHLTDRMSNDAGAAALFQEIFLWPAKERTVGTQPDSGQP